MIRGAGGASLAGAAITVAALLATGAMAQTSQAGPAASGSARAPASLLAPVFTDHAVLQRDQPIRLWGKAAPGAAVSIAFAGQTASATADASGRWRATLPARPAGGPFPLTVTQAGGATQALADIMVGDVWLCSGQSNMEFPVRRVGNGDYEVAGSANPQIRVLQVPRASRAQPQDAFSAPVAWRVAGPGAVDEFSAACFFMGRDLQASEKVPMGLINASWGGSVIQDWLTEEAAAGLGMYGDALDVLKMYETAPDQAQLRWRTVNQTWWVTHDKGSGAALPWSAPSFDDRAWKPITPGSFWEDAGDPDLKAFDGVVWFRTTVTLTAAQAASGATLKLGPIDDIDATWINGKIIGDGAGWDTPRAYAIPAGVLKPGANIIAVRVLDTGGGGGLWGKEAPSLTFTGGAAPAATGAWRYAISTPLGGMGSTPRPPWIGGSGLTTLYNGMVAPIGPYALKGFAWYQGEANVDDPAFYGRLLPTLIADWRKRFGNDQAAFLVVQLAGFGPAADTPQNSAWAGVREAQRRTVEADPRAGLAVAIDIGDRYDIHPVNKQEVGRRLARAARRAAYGHADSGSGPRPVAARRQGDRVLITFTDVSGKLGAYGSARPVGFEVCGPAGACRFADASLEAGAVAVLLSPGEVATKVRHCWADSPVCNLHDDLGLPATPFEIAVAP